MTLIKSISGIRGTIGGEPGNNLTPLDIVECTAAYAQIVKEKNYSNKIVVGRDGRITGQMVNSLVVSTLVAMGIDVVDLGLSTTPTVEIAVDAEGAAAGIIITASHNPKQWNALKFLNEKGEFISPQTGVKILKYIEKKEYSFSGISQLGNIIKKNEYIEYHIDKIIDLPYVDINLIKEHKYKVVVDCINSTGAISVLPLLERLGCEVISINDEITGDFAHNPEPLPENLKELSQKVIDNKADIGISVDPDVDRLAFVCENGEIFGEEYTLVAAADYILNKKRGVVVSNLSSSRALKDLAEKYGVEYFPAKVGEVNVVAKMKEVNAVIGGEGNGGVILPELHYGRDSLVGIVLVLSLLAERNSSLSNLKRTYPEYVIVKKKIELTKEMDGEQIILHFISKYEDEKINVEDGLKIDFDHGWVQLRKSNTEPIMRIYSESRTLKQAEELTGLIINEIKKVYLNNKK